MKDAVETLAILGGISCFLVVLLAYCLRQGVIGGGYAVRDAHRDAEPVRYWVNVAALALAAAFSSGAFVFMAWSMTSQLL